MKYFRHGRWTYREVTMHFPVFDRVGTTLLPAGSGVWVETGPDNLPRLHHTFQLPRAGAMNTMLYMFNQLMNYFLSSYEDNLSESHDAKSESGEGILFHYTTSTGTDA